MGVVPKKTKSPDVEVQPFEYFLTYLFGFVSGILMYVYRKDKDTIRFHAIQACLLGVVMFVLFIIPSYYIGSLLSFLVWLYALYVGYNASQGNKIIVPILGEFAEQMT